MVIIFTIILLLTPVKAQVTTPANLTVIGDSNSTGFSSSRDLRLDYNEIYPTLLESNYNVINYSIDGYTVQASNKYLYSNAFPFYKPGEDNIAFVLIGINSLRQDVTPQDTYLDIDWLANSLSQKGYDVYIGTYPPALNDPDLDLKIWKLNNRIRSNADNYTYIEIYNEFLALPNLQNYYMPDGFHINEIGHQEIYNLISNVL